MEEKKQYTALTIDRAAFLLLRVKKAFKKKKLQRKEREKSALLAASSRTDQRASCAGLESARTTKKPPPLLRSRTLPAIIVPGVNILQAQLGNYNLQDFGQQCQENQSLGTQQVSGGAKIGRYHSARFSFSRDDSATLDVRRKSAISRLCGSGNYGPERNSDGTLLLRVPAPHVVAARAYKISNNSGAGNTLFRLSRLLNQSGKSQMAVDDTNVTRRLSWERRDTIGSRIPRSSSIDSMVEAVWAESLSVPSAPLEKRPSLRIERPLTLVSPSVGRRMKGQRGVNAQVSPVMGKLQKQPPSKKMTDTVELRKNPSTLKRSRSVRASLRLIGHRFLHHKVQDNRLQKSPSLQALHRPVHSDYILRESRFSAPEKYQNLFSEMGPRSLVDPPPAVVAPKAAAVLEIPIKENCEPVWFRGGREERREGHKGWFLHGAEAGVGVEERGFQRASLRLSMRSKRKNGAWNAAFSSTSKLPTLSDEANMEVACSVPLSAGLPPPGQKPSKKQAKLMQQRMEKLARVNIHLHALFAAVEHGHLEKARTILESTDVDVNSLNSDGLSPLDVAVLSNNRPLVKMLIGFGAKEGNQFSTPEKLGSHLKHLLGEAEMRLQEFGGLLDEPCGASMNTRASFSTIIGNAYPTSAMTGCAGGDTEKQAIAWGRRAKTLKRLVLGFAQARPPDPPAVVALDIAAATTVCVRLQEAVAGDCPITTKFKVQWSTRANFSPITGEREILDISNSTCTLELTQGRRYYFRAACGNLKGYGGYLTSTPSCVVPSSWREVDNREARFGGRLKQLEQLMDEVRLVRPGSDLLENQAPNRRTQRKKTTIKQLFTAASKFQKNLRRGIYFSCILYHEDKVLVTNEDFLPTIEIDETFPSCIHTDHHWLMKVACTWNDTKSLRSDMEKNASSAIHFRSKLLSAALQMQSALCLQDLGQLYYKPLKDANGTVVISTINYVKTPKSVSVLNSRWLPMNKVYKKTVLSDDHSVSEMLMASLQEQINYHQVSGLKLSRGLYLTYLKMQSSVDLIQVVVPAKSPNMLPHCKIRENPHVSAEEWEYLKQQHLPDVVDNATEQQRTFLELVTSAAKRLFNYMDISTEEALTHRIYDTEIIDLTDEVSFIIVCPSAELSCLVPGQREMLLQRGDLLSLPLQVFEMIHLRTYQTTIIEKYSKLSCLLELDAATASHLHREAFSNTEVAVAKERLIKLQDLQTKLNSVWRCVRWLMDVISFARDRLMTGIPLKYILDKDIDTNVSPKKTLLQIPNRDPVIVKSTPGRGSWPGPGVTSTQSTHLSNEFSKSEQHLSTNDTISQYLSAYSDTESRKNSDSFNSDYYNAERLPPSRSEDMLFSIPTTCVSQRVRSSTISASSSPLLNVRPIYTGSLVSVNTINTNNTSDSMHSLSSDSETSCPIPISASTPRKNKQKAKLPPSRSMTNVKQNIVDNGVISELPKGKHLKVESSLIYPPGNLQTSLSKSLTNIRNPDLKIETSYLKSVEMVKKVDLLPDSAFKAPYKELHTDSAGGSTNSKDQQNQPGILQVYAAYETGLASGTSLKLHVTPRTTAREVVDLVVKQLNMAVVLKGKDGPIYPADKLKNFCLVAVIGARERCLRDDFKPLQLQNPWRKGRLYVRQKQDVLAALEHSSKHSAII